MDGQGLHGGASGEAPNNTVRMTLYLNDHINEVATTSFLFSRVSTEPTGLKLGRLDLETVTMML